METIPVSCFARIKNYSIKGIESLPRHRVAVIGQSADETKLKPRSDIKIVSFPKSFLSREIL